jgi:hypothetical protein
MEAGHWAPVAHPAILATQKAEIRRTKVWSQPKQIVHETLSKKNLDKNRAGGVAQVVECLPGKHEALSWNASPTKKKKKKKERK